MRDVFDFIYWLLLLSFFKIFDFKNPCFFINIVPCTFKERNKLASRILKGAEDVLEGGNDAYEGRISASVGFLKDIFSI